jgi:hypothetical protein
LEPEIAALETRLDSFHLAEREGALAELVALAGKGRIALPCPAEIVNLHAHSFYSYNAWGYSPSHIAWRARREGLAVVGLVDFDVLDGIDEFFAACRAVGIKGVAGMETRAYIPEFATREINSPGEPGITYHMGVGFVRSEISDLEAAEFAALLRRNARQRNVEMVRRVNAFLDPVKLDYEKDVCPLSPAATPTERHLCAAYQKKAGELFPDPAARTKFWAERFGVPAEKAAALVGDSVNLQATIRSKTMKQGGAGYMKPTAETFPLMTDVNRFVARLGAIPTLTWLDGTSQGEKDIEELVELQMAAGVAAMNIVPDRNWNIKDAAVKAVKVKNLYDVMKLADRKGLPIVVGTEMNAPGLKFVDSFAAPELAPVVPSFLRGAYIIAGHTAASLKDGRGYLSDWACETFKDVHKKNDYFYELGKVVRA